MFYAVAISSKLFMSKELESIVIFSDSVTIVAREKNYKLGLLYHTTKTRQTENMYLLSISPLFFIVHLVYRAVEVKLLVDLLLSIESVCCIQRQK